VVAAFELIPALDLSGGRLARMKGGDPATLRAVGGDPLDLARRFVDAGARWIHVVDLDAALTGRPANLDLLEGIAALPVRVEAGGGLSPEGVSDTLARGADRAILGASALEDRGVIEGAMARHGDRVGVALDVRDGRVAPRGTSLVGPALDDALRTLERVRPSFVVYSNADLDGTMQGPDLEGVRRVAARLDAPLFASGGIRSLDDVRAVADLLPRPAGLIVGRALHTGALDLAEALALVAAVSGEGR
jgi:phosphoribosylformimino-5-aminoimidazole carboxamide ribonucleotide (ProFAR) isomerase